MHVNNFYTRTPPRGHTLTHRLVLGSTFVDLKHLAVSLTVQTYVALVRTLLNAHLLCAFTSKRQNCFRKINALPTCVRESYNERAYGNAKILIGREPKAKI